MKYRAKMLSSAVPKQALQTFHLRAEKIAWREIDGVIIALDMNASSYIQVGGSGALLWPKLLDGATIAELAEFLQARFKLDLAVARADVARFIDALAERGLIES